jgi:hypothetical protein
MAGGSRRAVDQNPETFLCKTILGPSPPGCHLSPWGWTMRSPRIFWGTATTKEPHTRSVASGELRGASAGTFRTSGAVKVRVRWREAHHRLGGLRGATVTGEG